MPIFVTSCHSLTYNRTPVTLTKNTVAVEDTEITFEHYAMPTERQQRALDLLGVSPRL